MPSGQITHLLCFLCMQGLPNLETGEASPTVGSPSVSSCNWESLNSLDSQLKGTHSSHGGALERGPQQQQKAANSSGPVVTAADGAPAPQGAQGPSKSQHAPSGIKRLGLLSPIMPPSDPWQAQTQQLLLSLQQLGLRAGDGLALGATGGTSGTSLPNSADPVATELRRTDSPSAAVGADLPFNLWSPQGMAVSPQPASQQLPTCPPAGAGQLRQASQCMDWGAVQNGLLLQQHLVQLQQHQATQVGGCGGPARMGCRGTSQQLPAHNLNLGPVPLNRLPIGLLVGAQDGPAMGKYLVGKPGLKGSGYMRLPEGLESQRKQVAECNINKVITKRLASAVHYQQVCVPGRISTGPTLNFRRNASQLHWVCSQAALNTWEGQVCADFVRSCRGCWLPQP